MLYWAAVFLIIALISAFLGFGGVAVASVDTARTLFYIFIVLFAFSFILGLMRRV